MEYRWEVLASTAISPISPSDSVDHYNKIGSITFRASLIHTYIQIWLQLTGIAMKMSDREEN